MPQTPEWDEERAANERQKHFQKRADAALEIARRKAQREAAIAEIAETAAKLWGATDPSQVTVIMCNRGRQP